jgi:hypothetical protein
MPKAPSKRTFNTRWSPPSLGQRKYVTRSTTQNEKPTELPEEELTVEEQLEYDEKIRKENEEFKDFKRKLAAQTVLEVVQQIKDRIQDKDSGYADSNIYNESRKYQYLIYTVLPKLEERYGIEVEPYKYHLYDENDMIPWYNYLIGRTTTLIDFVEAHEHSKHEREKLGGTRRRSRRRIKRRYGRSRRKM